MNTRRLPYSGISTALFLATGFATACLGEPVVVRTEILGPFAGPGATLHEDNLGPPAIRFYGTDLGFTYKHDGLLHIIFGDTMADESGAPIEASTGREHEDSFGNIDLDQWNRPDLFDEENIPLVRLGQNPESAETAAIDPGHRMEGFKTPVGGFSNGEHEFGLFFLSKPRGCRADGDCAAGMKCDTGVGYVGDRHDTDKGLTLSCFDGSGPACNAATLLDADGSPLDDSGFCSDPSSSIWADTPVGRVAAVNVALRLGFRDAHTPKRYLPMHDWFTNKYLNVAARTVERFDSALPPSDPRQDYAIATGSGDMQRVFLWGRPTFIGVNATGRSGSLYFAYVDMPVDGESRWQVNYYTGTNEDGVPQFSDRESDAAALDLDASIPGIQPEEHYDIVNQHSVVWVEHLNKWVMFYGGGLTNLPYLPTMPDCGILELFVGAECKSVDMGNGAIRMRAADYAWGPWSPPQDVLVGGDPRAAGSGQYGPGGVLRHPRCTDPTCAPHTAARTRRPDEYGFLYSANLVAEWIRPTDNGVELIWNVSTWDPYGVVLLRTVIAK